MVLTPALPSTCAIDPVEPWPPLIPPVPFIAQFQLSHCSILYVQTIFRPYQEKTRLQSMNCLLLRPLF